MIVDVEVDDDGREVIHCERISWHGTSARTPDGYTVQIGMLGDLGMAVIRIQPPWHKNFYVTVMRGGNCAQVAEREIERHRTLTGEIPAPTSHGNAFLN